MTTFDQTWIENRKKFRKRMTGTGMRLDAETGYMEPSRQRGFMAQQRQLFISRYRVCSNQREVAKSVGVTVGTIYDAICLDPKFREDYLACSFIFTRDKHLTEQNVQLKAVEKSAVLLDLAKKAQEYR